jgi:two-component sensor histidine kinase
MDEATAQADLRLRHRDLLAELGTEALRIRELDPLLAEASRIVAEGMGTKFAKVLEYHPAENNLLVRAGVGWHEGVVGQATLGADDASPAGYALKTSEPVIANDLATEQRFRTPALLAEHGIRRAINVIIQGDGTAYGVLEADSRRPGTFLATDVAFLQAAANLLGVAIERNRRETELERSLQARELLIREADHRIKNSLQLVVSLLSLQRSKLTDAEATAALDSAIGRVCAVAEAHRALHQSQDLTTIAFDHMLRDLCRHMGELSPAIAISCNAEENLEIDAERAIPLGLIVSELLTNAARHAYPEGSTGMIEARAQRTQGGLEVSVTDRGVGVGPGAAPSRTLGINIVQALARQIGLDVQTISHPGQGTSVTLRLPSSPRAPPSGS